MFQIVKVNFRSSHGKSSLKVPFPETDEKKMILKAGSQGDMGALVL